MADPYRLFGAELSPYSVKVRSYCRYKGIPHHWIIRSVAVQEEYQHYAKLPIIPLVVTPEKTGIQDSTPIIEHLESLYPAPSIHPADPVTRFISALVEEFGDEWGNKWMFHYRWVREVDQLSTAGRIARMMMPMADEQRHAHMQAQVRERMVKRVWFVGSSEQTAPQIEESFCEAIAKGSEEFSIELHGQTWTQKPQKYHAKSLQVLRDKYSAITDKSALDPVLERAGCLAGLWQSS